MVSQLTLAGNITENEALQKAQAFLNKQQKVMKQGLRLAAKGSQLTPSETMAESYYVFNIGQTDGFIIVSGDDRAPSILGYTDQGAFDTNNMPENMKTWLQSYSDQLEYLKAHPETEIARVALDEHASVAPLVTSKWDQDDPYNRMCPIDPTTNERSVTGCTATAMAQLLYYYKYPEKTTKTIPAYVTEARKIKMDAIPVTTFDWANMKDEYSGKEDNAAINAVSTLMLVCGVVDNMDYSSSQSGAHTEPLCEIFQTYFDFDATTTHINRSDYLANAWNNIIYNEVANQRPVVYSGYSSGGGHAFIIDGYDKEGLFHVNWGWSGSNDGYYLLSILNPHNNSGSGASPSADGYSYYQDAMIGAKPNEGTVIEPQKPRMTTYSITAPQKTIQKSNGKFSFTVIGQLYNLTGSTCNFDMGTGVFNKNNELLHAKYNITYEFDTKYGLGSYNFQAEVPSLPDGHYIITLVSRKHGESEWQQNNDSKNYYLSATISGETLTLREVAKDIEGTVEIVGIQEVGNELTAKFNIKNKGTLFNDVLYLMLDDKRLGGRHFEVEEGENEILEMSFEPTEAGAKHLSLIYNYWELNDTKDQWIQKTAEVAAADLNIAEGKTHKLVFNNGKVTNATSKIINSSTAQIQVKVNNSGQYDYNSNIKTYFLKEASNGYYYTKGEVTTPLNLEKGKTTTMNINVEGLTDGKWRFILLYKTQGQYPTSFNNGYRIGDYTVVVPEVVDNIETITTEQVPTAIYNLNGQKVTLPQKGLYIINGKKVMMK